MSARLARFTKPVLLGLVILVARIGPLAADPVAVRFAEGVAHGFLVLRTVDGASVAQGDLLQIARGGEVTKRVTFRFHDGSVFEETVVFTEQDVYTMQSYGVVQRGPLFTEDTEISLARAGGRYRVKTTAHADGHAEVLEGTLDLPLDVYNGMLLTVLKDLPAGTSETVHYVAFTPKPRLIQFDLLPAGEQQVLVGALAKTAVHYVLKPRLGVWLGLFATMLGRTPPDNHAWFVTEDVPAFAGFEGSLYMAGPVWRIELMSPRWPAPAVAVK